MPDLSAIISVAREVRPVNGIVDLSSLKTAVALLPDAAPSPLACKYLDEISAICFLLVVLAREQVAEEWFDKNYSGKGSWADETPDTETTHQLRSVLSHLIKPKVPLVRRV